MTALRFFGLIVCGFLVLAGIVVFFGALMGQKAQGPPDNHGGES